MLRDRTPDEQTFGRTAAATRTRQRPSLQRIFGEFHGGRLLTLVFVGLLLMLIVRPVVMSLLSYHRTANLLEHRRSEVSDLQKRHDTLQATAKYYETDVFLAERAREFGLVRPGEQAYVIRELARPPRQ